MTLKKYAILLVMLFIVTSFSACKKEEKEKDVYFSVRIDDKYGVINQLGEEVIPFVYDELSPFTTDGVALARDEEGYHLINIDQEIIATHPLIETLEQYLEYHDYTPQRPRMFRGSDDENDYLYNGKGELILSVTIDKNSMFSILNDYLVCSVDHMISLVKIDAFSSDLIETYDSIIPFYEREGYLAQKDSTYYFLDSRMDVIKSIEVDGGFIYSMGSYAMHSNQMHWTYYSVLGETIGNIEGYDYQTFMIQDQYIVFSNDLNLYGVDHISGTRISEAIYHQISDQGNMIYGVKTDGSTDFYEGFDIIFSKNDYVASGYYKKADENLYVITTLFNYTYHTLEVSYVNQDGIFISGPYQSAYPFNDQGLAIIEELDFKDYIINREFQKISSAFDFIEYLDEENMYYAVNVDENDHETVFILDQFGEIKQTIQGINMRIYGRWLINTRITDDYEVEFIEMFYIDSNLDLITQDLMTYDRLKTINELDLMISGNLNIREYFMLRYFEILTKDQTLTYEKELYDGYFLFKEDGKYKIMTHDLVMVGELTFDEVSTMPTYESRLLID